MDAAAARPEPDLYSETEYPRVAGWSPLQALTDGRWKTIRAGGATRGVRPAERSARGARRRGVAAGGRRRDGGAHRRHSRGAAASRRAARFRPSRRSGCARSATSPARRSRRRWRRRAESGRADRRVERSSRTRSSALNARQAARPRPRLTKLAAANPDAPVFQTTYARALKESGTDGARARGLPAAAQRWPTDATAAARPRGRRARGGEQRRQARPPARCATRRRAPIRPRWRSRPTARSAHNGLGLLAVDRDRPQDAVKRIRARRRRSIRTTRRTGRISATRAARSAIAAAPNRRTAARSTSTRATPTPPTASACCWSKRRRPAEAVAVVRARDRGRARFRRGAAEPRHRAAAGGQTARAADAYRQVLAAPPRYKRERDAAAKLLAALGAAMRSITADGA